MDVDLRSSLLTLGRADASIALLSLNRSLDILSSQLTLEKTSKLVKCSLNRSLCRHSR